MADVCRLLRRNLLVPSRIAKNTCRDINRSGVSCKVATPQIYATNGEYNSSNKKKVVIVGSGWSDLGAAYHLCNQGFDVTVLGDEYGFGDPDDIRIPFARNVCSSFDDSSGCNLNDLFDEHRNSPATILQADFYHANELLPLKDEHIAAKVMSYLSKCVKDFEAARVTNVEITRFPKSLTHFFPAGNRVVDFLGEGNYAKIIPLEEDEPHIQALRNLNRNFKELISQFIHVCVN
ncbi:hypothetical protein OIU85_028337 [Salix viminalis]|uniref:Uncharacterized protein n=1 Tax=Salix viminalis TaxID=40686 RepID=A0A9Q0TBU8_SALVM|nr:hypothetical protein OIU85_028337 [Salix viminalis]